MFAIGVIMYILLCGYPPFYRCPTAILPTRRCSSFSPFLLFWRAVRRERGRMHTHSHTLFSASCHHSHCSQHTTRSENDDDNELFDKTIACNYEFHEDAWGSISEVSHQNHSRLHTRSFTVCSSFCLFLCFSTDLSIFLSKRSNVCPMDSHTQHNAQAPAEPADGTWSSSPPPHANRTRRT